MPQTAVGIPDRNVYGELSKLAPGQLIDWIVQRHDATRAGLHRDVRFGTPETGLYSWAMRKEMPEPGERRLAIQQPIHSHDYKSFEGVIPAGQYGAGRVSTQDEGKILITKVNDDSVHFTLAHRRYPERFVLMRDQKDNKKFLLINTTPTAPVPYKKVHYAKVSPERAEQIIDNLQPGASVQAKVDGAAALTTVLKDRLETVSYRSSKVHGGPIIHSERIMHGLPTIPNIPPALVGTILRSELYGTRGNKSIPVQELGALLNSSLTKSIGRQKDQDIKLRNLVFDIQQHGKKPIPEGTPYNQRLNMTRDVLNQLGTLAANASTAPSGHALLSKEQLGSAFHGPEVTGEATTSEAASKLFGDIRAGKNPYTREGIVIHPEHGKPIKSKLMEDHDVYVRDFFPGKGKYQDVGVGGFLYSHSPTGPIVGEVGTGMSDEMRRDMWENPHEYRGRVAKVRSQERFPTGALRAPALIAMHEDLPTASV